MFSRLLALTGLVLIAPIAFAQSAAPPEGGWQAGKQYFIVDPAIPSNSGKIEVTEVFSYACPACNFAFPEMDKIKKSLPPNAVMNYVPASFNPTESWPLFQRAYFTAVALGVADKAHDAMFDAVWKKRELAIMDEDGRTLKKPPPSLEDIAAFYAQYGVKSEDFVATANSFSINTQMKRADAYVKAASVESTPTLIVAGKYRLTFASAGGMEQAEQLVRYLVQQESAGK